MSVLFRTCKIFIDFRDIMCHTDLYVIKYIISGIISGTLKLNFFNNMANEFSQLEDSKLLQILSMKANYNPLMDFIEYDKIIDCNVFGEMNNLYNHILYDDQIFTDLIFTKTADSIKLLLKSKECGSVDIFMDNISSVVYKQLHDFIGDCTKIKIITGDKESLLKSKYYDSYFLSDIMDINSILDIPRVNVCDVISLYTRCNTTIVNSEGDTKLILPKPADKLLSENKLSITTLEPLY